MEIATTSFEFSTPKYGLIRLLGRQDFPYDKKPCGTAVAVQLNLKLLTAHMTVQNEEGGNLQLNSKLLTKSMGAPEVNFLNA